MTKKNKVLITGSSGLVGSECSKFFCEKGFDVFGIDNNLRSYLFGSDASTDNEGRLLKKNYRNFHLIQKDIRDKEAIRKVYINYGPFDYIIHTAAQPAHDWSIDHALEDWEINSMGTMIMLENFRQYSYDSVFIQVSTSKVYDDNVNNLPLLEKKTRWDLPYSHKYYKGVDESMSIETCIHSLFGVSKTSGDLAAQEYGRYFKLKTAVFRPVCITGSAHKGARLHGYLSYLVKCIAQGEKYVINGYKGKQVRDNIHAYDLVTAFWEVCKNPQYSYGEVYNIGAGRLSNNSIIEAVAQTEKILNIKAKIEYSKNNRIGDHMWCIFNSEKFQKRYPKWKITYDNDRIMNELCETWSDKKRLQ